MLNKLISVLCFSVISLAAQAEVIVSPVSVISNSFGEILPIENIFNQSGLSAAYTNGVTNFDSYNPTHSRGSVGAFNLWRSFGVIPGNIVFDLGQQYQVEQFALWQVPFLGPPRMSHIAGFKLFTTDSLVVANDVNSASWVDVSTGGNAYTAVQNSANKQTFDLVDSTARYVRLNILSSYSASVVSIGEIAFDVTAVSAVPEPSTYAMLLAGLGLLGFAKRRQLS